MDSRSRERHAEKQLDFRAATRALSALLTRTSLAGRQKRQMRVKSVPTVRGVNAVPRPAAWFAHVDPFVDGAELTEPSTPRWKR
jgi:hypothetical protein